MTTLEIEFDNEYPERIMYCGDKIRIGGDKDGEFTKTLKKMLMTRELVKQLDQDLKEELDKFIMNGDVIMPLLEQNLHLIKYLQENCDKLKDIGDKKNIHITDENYIKWCSRNKERFDYYTNKQLEFKKRIADCLAVVPHSPGATIYHRYTE